MADTNQAMTIPKELMDPAYVYIWGAEEPRGRVEQQLDGYEDVNINIGTGDLLKGHPLVQADGKVRIGDAVLMRCKRERAEERLRTNALKASEWVKKVREEYKAEGARLGVQAYTEDTP